MTAILDRFTTNPLQTPIGQRIVRATDEMQPSEDWTLFMQIVDIVNTTEEGPKDASRAIRKRISMLKNSKALLFTLLLLETLMKNCGYRFHIHVCQKDYINDLVKVIHPRYTPSVLVQEKVLELIHSWTMAFRTHPDLKGVVLVHAELTEKGIEFPDVDASGFPKTDNQSLTLQHSPIRKPISENVQRVPTAPVQQSPTTQRNSRQKHVNKLRGELKIVAENASVFNKMLTELSPGQEEDDEFSLLVDLNDTCRQMQSRLVELVENSRCEELSVEILSLNDELNNAFIRYDRYQRIRQIQKQPDKGINNSEGVLIADLPRPSQTPTRNQVNNENFAYKQQSNIRERPDLSSGASIEAKLLPGRSENVLFSDLPEDNDSFDAFLGVRAAVGNSSEQITGSPTIQSRNMVSKDLMGTDVTETDNWLRSSDLRVPQQPSKPDTMTSEEFDKFLAAKRHLQSNSPSGVTQVKPAADNFF